MDEYKSKQTKNQALLLNQDDEDCYSFYDQLNFFFHNFVDAIFNENKDRLKELMDESFELVNIKQNNQLPSFCFDIEIANSFIKSFQIEFYPNLFKYTIYIFQNIYVARFCANLEAFLSTDLFKHLWNSLSFVDKDESLTIIHIIKEAMKQSQNSFIYFNGLISHNEYFKKLTPRFRENQYIEFILEYMDICANGMKNRVSELDINLFYSFIFNMLNFAIPSTGENYLIDPFQKSTTLKLINYFQKYVLIDTNFLNRRLFIQILDIFFLWRFIFISDIDIFFNAIRVLSYLCSFKYPIKFQNQKKEEITKMEHIIFDIFVSGCDIFSKLVTDLSYFSNIPFDSPYYDILGHLCNIITRFSKQIHERRYPSKPRDLNPNPTFEFIKNKTIPVVMDILVKRDIYSKAQACKMAIFILELKIGLIIQMFNFEVIPNIASLIESDDVILMRNALKFFLKLANSFKEYKDKVIYNIKHDIENCNLISLIDQIIFNQDEDEIYSEILDLAKITKKFLLQNIINVTNLPK